MQSCPPRILKSIAADVFALDQVSSGKNVGQIGEDLRTGEIAAAAGRTLRPQDIGLLSSVGCSVVPVVRKPRVRILITGNEILPAGTPPEGYRIADANGPMLAALVSRDGGEPHLSDIIPDDPAAIRAALEQPADIIVVSGGSSVGPGGLRADAVGRTRRTGHPRHRHAPQQPDRHGAPCTGDSYFCSPAIPCRAFVLTISSRAERFAPPVAARRDWPYRCDPRPLSAKARLHRRPRSTTPASASPPTMPNRWPSAAHRSSAPPRAPTAL